MGAYIYIYTVQFAYMQVQYVNAIHSLCVLSVVKMLLPRKLRLDKQ